MAIISIVTFPDKTARIVTNNKRQVGAIVEHALTIADDVRVSLLTTGGVAAGSWQVVFRRNDTTDAAELAAFLTFPEPGE